MLCERCKKPLRALDAAMTKKLVNRAAERFYCLHCLAETFRVSETLLLEKAHEYQRGGCALFHGISIPNAPSEKELSALTPSEK